MKMPNSYMREMNNESMRTRIDIIFYWQIQFHYSRISSSWTDPFYDIEYPVFQKIEFMCTEIENTIDKIPSENTYDQ